MLSSNLSSQVIAALIIGLLIALACQLLLTALGLAIGVTIWGAQTFNPSELNATLEESDAEAQADAPTTIKLTTAAGWGLLLTINSVLFVACFLAVKFCEVNRPLAGTILGIVIWSAYFQIMTWVSSKAAGSLVAFILSSAIAGFRQIVSVMGSVIQSAMANPKSTLTEKATTELVQTEVQSALNRLSIPTLIESYIDTLPSSRLDLEALQSQFATLLETLNQHHAAQLDQRSPITRQRFADLIRQHSNLTSDELDDVVEQLDDIWQAHTQSTEIDPIEKLQVLLQQIHPHEDAVIQDVADDLDDAPGSSYAAASFSAKQAIANLLKQFPGAVQSIDLDWLKRVLRDRVDLSDIDVQTVWHQISPILSQWVEPDSEHLQPDQIIQDDVNDYLRCVFPWRLQHESVQHEFRDVLYDPEAAPDQLRPQLERLQRQQLVDVLTQRGDLTTEQIEETASTLEAIRRSVLETVRAAEQQQQSNPDKFKDHKKEKKAKKGKHKKKGKKAKKTRYAETARRSFHYTEHAASQQAEHGQVAEAIAELQQSVENYLLYARLDHIAPEAVKQKLDLLIDELDLPLDTLRQTLPTLPSEPLEHILQRRQGLAASDRKKLIEQMQSHWQTLLRVSTEPTDRALQATIETALLGLAKQQIGHGSPVEVDPSALLQHCPDLGDRPYVLRRVLSQVNWVALEQQLQHEMGAAEAQAEKAIEAVRVAVHPLLKAPRRWRVRRHTPPDDIWANLTDYLLHGDRASFTLDAIRQNLGWLLKTSSLSLSPLPGVAARLGDRLAEIDLAALQQTLLQRKDLATEDVQEIVARVETVIQQLAEQLVEQSQGTVQSVLGQIQSVLEHVNLTRLDASSLRAAVQQFFEHPPERFQRLSNPLNLLLDSVPFEQLGSYVAEMSQEVLTTILSSQQWSNQWQHEVEGIRGWVQQRIAEVEQEIEQRKTALQQRAMHQLEQTQKAIATAAWWLLAIAFSSAITSGLAGAIAVTGLPIAAWFNSASALVQRFTSLF